MISVGVKVLDPACTPQRVKRGDAAYDLCAKEDFWVGPGRSVIVPLGVAFEMPMDIKGILTHRSSMAFKFDIIASYGLIDSSFNGGEVKAKLFNLGDEVREFKKGDRICQIQFDKVERIFLSHKSDIDTGKEGFGSSGGYGGK